MDLPLTSSQVDVVQYALIYLRKNFNKTEAPNNLTAEDLKDIGDVLKLIDGDMYYADPGEESENGVTGPAEYYDEDGL